MVRALEVEGFRFGDISDGPFDHHYGKKGRVAVALPFVAYPFSCMAFFVLEAHRFPVPQNCPLNMHDSFMSQDSKNRCCWSFSSTLATLSVYIFQAGLLKCKIKAQCAACYAKRIPGFDDIGGFLLDLCDSTSFRSLPAKSFIDLSLSL